METDEALNWSPKKVLCEGRVASTEWYKAAIKAKVLCKCYIWSGGNLTYSFWKISMDTYPVTMYLEVIQTAFHQK